MRMHIISIFLLTIQMVCSTDIQGAQYLQDTIKDLSNHIHRNINRKISQVRAAPPIDRAHGNKENVPSLHLTKSELAAIYENAVNKGETVKLNTGDGSSHPINAVIHQIDEEDENDGNKKRHENENGGYYYYYYPLKSFIDDVSTAANKPDKLKLDQYVHHEHHNYHHLTKSVPKPHLHSHTHQHNVHFEQTKNTMDVDMDKKTKGLEPLFMAISGFIGMTIMFILSILVLPKFEKLKPKGFKSNGMEVTSITRVAIEAIEGKDCGERIACEIGKVANALNLYDNRFIILLRRLSPFTLVKKIDKIGKYTEKKFKCDAIQCKRKGKPVIQLKTNQKLNI